MYLVACLVVLVVLQGSQPASGRRRLGRPAASVIGALERHHHSPVCDTTPYGKWQGGLDSSRMLNSDLTPMDAGTLKLYKKERTQPMGDILMKSVACETTVRLMHQAALTKGLTMQERMDLLTSGECVGIPKNGYLRAKRFLVMATIAQLNSELCIEEIPMHCQPDLGSFKCIEHFYGSVSTARAHEILQPPPKSAACYLLVGHSALG
jgi:hypothetical protein